MGIYARPLSQVVEWVADRAPLATDDVTAGVRVGSVWVYDDRRWHCLDATAGAALWWESAAADSVAALIAALNSLNVAHTAAGTGAVTRTVRAAVREVAMSPADFGAVGNGTSDDTAALQAMLDASGTHGVPARLVPGQTYRITARLNLSTGCDIAGAPGAKIVMDGASFTSTSKSYGTTGVGLNALNVSNVRIRDGLRVEQSGMASGRWVTSIAFRGVAGGLIEAETWGMNAGNGITIDSCSDVVIRDAIIRDGLLLRATTGQLTGIWVEDDRLSGVSSRRVHVIGGRIYNLLADAAFVTSFGYQTDGITIAPGAQVIFTGGDVSDTGDGIDCQGDDCIIANFTVRNSYNAGVKVIHGARRCIIGPGTVDRAGWYGVGVFGSNTVGRDAVGNVIVGVRVSNVHYNTAWGASTRSAFTVDDQGATNLCVETAFIGCQVNDNSGAQYDFRSVGTGTRNGFFACIGSGDATVSEYQFANTATRALRVPDTSGVLRLGGIAVGSRRWEVDGNGAVTQRNDDNGVPTFHTVQNGNIAASGQGGTIRQAQYGAAGSVVSSPQAFREQVLSTDTWAAAGNRSARYLMQLVLANTLTDVLDVRPGAGIVLMVDQAGAIKFRTVKAGANGSGPGGVGCALWCDN